MKSWLLIEIKIKLFLLELVYTFETWSQINIVWQLAKARKAEFSRKRNFAAVVKFFNVTSLVPSFSLDLNQLIIFKNFTTVAKVLFLLNAANILMQFLFYILVQESKTALYLHWYRNVKIDRLVVFFPPRLSIHHKNFTIYR